MKDRKILHAKVLTMALATLTYGVALAQSTSTNSVPATYVYNVSAGNTNSPGFIWNVSQVTKAEPNTISWAETQLAGEEGPNLADPTQVYSEAAGNGVVPSDPTLPITFSIPAFINFSDGTSPPRTDLPMPDGIVGTPGNPPDAAGGTDNIAAEALTYLVLPQGVTLMGVRSDDGFQLQIGAANPADRYSTNAKVMEFYNGGRGAADSIVTLNVPKAGLYAARLLYYQGGGNAGVEWYSFPPAGTTNVTLGENNTGTNAVLINDVADSGIAAYQSLTTAPLGSYLSSVSPAPGATGVSLEPTITATIVNGAVPVTGLTLTIDGTPVTGTVTTTTNGATISYTATSPLATLPTHSVKVTWNDNGTTLGVSSTFISASFLQLDPATIVTPDTTKPGFRFNIFANSMDPYTSSANGVQGGDSQNLDNTELGLNGLLPDGSGGFLANMVSISNNGAAVGAAPALGGPAAPAEFIITNSVDLSAVNMPGLPASDGSTDPVHTELLTYVHLPVGLTTFTLNLNGFYRAFAGSWDYLAAAEAGEVNDSVAGTTSFAVFATTAGYYPLRITTFNLNGTVQESLFTTSATTGSNTLVGDTANGGYAAYYALTTPSKPYVRYASPRPVPRQVEYPNNRVLVRIQDADTKVTDSTATLNLDGKAATVTKTRIGDVLEMNWAATTLQTPAEIHTGILSYQDSGSSTINKQWTFLNLKSVWLDTATPGSYIPTNAIVESFSEYMDGTEFTNDTPTGNWYKSAQPENPLVDIAPIFAAPITNWYVWNFDGPGNSGFDITAPNSEAYANFLCVDLNTFSGIEGDSLNTAPNEMINGVPLTQLVADPSENILMAESDNRTGSSPGQNQFAMSKPFDLSGVTNPVLAFQAILKQNQDDIYTLEYSVDGAVTWAPLMYVLDGHEFNDPGDPPDIHIKLDNTVDVNSTLFHDTNPGEVPTWTDATGDVNNSFASALGAPISDSLAPFFAPRINDDHYDSKRVEVVRMPLASHKSDVRLRLCQMGTCSWYYGVGQLAIYDVAPSGALVPTGLPSTTTTSPVLSASAAGGMFTVSWTGSGTLQSATTLTGNNSDWSAVTPAPTGNTYTTAIAAGAKFFRLLSN